MLRSLLFVEFSFINFLYIPILSFFMAGVDEAVEARINKNGKVFEILVDCDNATKYKNSLLTDLSEVVVTRDVFSDSRKSIVVPREELIEAFGTDNLNRIFDEILRNGHINLTTEYRNKLKERVENQVVDFIVRNSSDPKTGMPHPPLRIKNAMEQIKLRIDIFKNPEIQAKEIVEELRSIIPISMKRLRFHINIPAHFAGKAFNALRKVGEVQSQNWEGNGNLTIVVEIPGGLRDELFSQVMELTHGEGNLKQVS